MLNRFDNGNRSLAFVHDLSREELQTLQQECASKLNLPTHFHDTLKRDGSAAPEMIVIPPGQFEMGSDSSEFGHRAEESPRHYVHIQNPYAIGRCTITADEFEKFRQDTGWVIRYDLIWAKGKHPVMNIRVGDAKLYAEWLSDQTGHHYRLPSEAEWEYAARAGSDTPFHFGDDISCKQAHFDSTEPYKERREKRRFFFPRCMPPATSIEVGSKPPNLWGVHEMHGNVWEFTQNPWRNSHADASRTGVVPPKPRGSRLPRIVTKGGSWFDGAIQARSAARRPRLEDELDTNLGFRLVRELSAPSGISDLPPSEPKEARRDKLFA